MAEELVFEARHRIYYQTEQPVPIAEVVQALQALDGLLRDVPRVIEGLVGVRIERGEFYVERVQSGSLQEDILIKLFFENRAEFDAFLDKIRARPVLRNTIVGAALGGLLVYGTMWAAGKKEPPPAITATNNVIINIGGEVKLTPEGLEAIVRSAVSSQRDTAQNAVRFFGPARSDPKASVTLQDPTAPASSPKVEFSAAAIAETPKRVDVAPNRRIQDLPKVEVEIRAMDRDSKKTGWAGKIEGKTGRVRIELDPAVDDADLFGKDAVIADVTLVYEPRGKGMQLTPAKIFIRKIH